MPVIFSSPSSRFSNHSCLRLPAPSPEADPKTKFPRMWFMRTCPQEWGNGAGKGRRRNKDVKSESHGKYLELSASEGSGDSEGHLQSCPIRGGIIVLTKVCSQVSISSCVQAKPSLAAWGQPSSRELRGCLLGVRAPGARHRWGRNWWGVGKQWHCRWCSDHTPAVGFCWEAWPSSAFQVQAIGRCKQK